MDKHILEGQVWQIQPMLSGQQVWGIFILEFMNPDVFIKGKGITGLLRKVLKGLVPGRRKSSNLPSWRSDNILFICTHNWEHYRFAHFRSVDNGQASRMSTFGWGPGTSSRTACEFNLPELEWPDNPSDKESWIKKWSKAFDKEELTKQFYKSFAYLYYQIAEEIGETPGFRTNAQEQAQLLLDRLLFLSFLQKKRWLNNETDFLYSRFQECYVKDPEGYSYYAYVLYPLFEALSSRGKRPEQVGIVPFLNGGLFNLELGTDQKSALTQVRLKVKNSTFKKLFDELLNKYNFTVMEDTPLNREVAVDPEMLGKVFETVVLVSDTGGDFQAPDLRKATGSFYTPRIVVHFICREVLLKYLSARLGGEVWEGRIKQLLDIDASDGLDRNDLKLLREILEPEEAADLRKAIERIKCCDPSVGSGAFAVGLLQEISNLILLCEACERGKDPRLEKGTNYLYERKLRIIENSIYGVDIQAKAVDICKLRLWLALVVDYELGVDPGECTVEMFEESISSIPPLPNLAYKIQQGDALLDQIHGVPFRLDRVNPDSGMIEIIEQITAEHQKFFKEEDPVKKRHIRKTVLGLRLKLSRMQLNAEMEQNLPVVQEGLFGETAKNAAMRRWRDAEEAKIKKALEEVNRLESQLSVFKSKSRLSKEDEDRLTYLENGEGNNITFAWRLDFPEVFNRITKGSSTVSGKLVLTAGSGQQELVENIIVDDGFDIMVGNPPFVTSRNKEKRELYRERWQPYCYGQYHLLVPFFPRSFGIMAKNAQLGLIVSNAFAKREFGKPLIEGFFPTVEINKIVDCSGLMFPGHGTPTCITFGRNRKPLIDSAIRVAAILPGGGDLRTAPEDSPLWTTIEAHHNDKGYSDSRVVVSDRTREDMSKWPWNFEALAAETKQELENKCINRLKDFLKGSIGRVCFSGADELFFVSEDFCRRSKLNKELICQFMEGDTLRDWSAERTVCIFPYDEKGVVLREEHTSRVERLFSPWKKFLENRLSYGQTQIDRGLKWYEYSLLFPERTKAGMAISWVEIATHNHALIFNKPLIANRSNPIFEIKELNPIGYDLLSAILNSPPVLFCLKQVCYNKGAGDAEEKDRFEYAGGKVEQLPIPNIIAIALEGEENALSKRLTNLSQVCSEHGQLLPSLSMKKLFEKEGEAYDSWNRSLPGYIPPHPLIGDPFTDSASLQDALSKVISEREMLRAQMIALQEEMDWLVYEVYGLIDEKADCKMQSDDLPESISLGQRPFEIWTDAKEDLNAACELIPEDWSEDRRRLWINRFIAIRDNEHIQRIEKPVYKRRWYQPASYEKQFEKAYVWWLMEKAEWWLEKKKAGGPVTIDDWAEALWEDNRIQAASEIAKRAKTLGAFLKVLKKVVNETTVPEEIPFAVPWAELQIKGKKIPAKVKNIRGKLNVPRERFRLKGKNEYLWAGLDWK